jgi:hypothetical protein
MKSSCKVPGPFIPLSCCLPSHPSFASFNTFCGQPIIFRLLPPTPPSCCLPSHPSFGLFHFLSLITLPSSASVLPHHPSCCLPSHSSLGLFQFLSLITLSFAASVLPYHLPSPNPVQLCSTFNLWFSFPRSLSK